jgi:hypothetical protein
MPDCLFFCRLKINHDSLEFIFEFSTIANTYSFRQKNRPIIKMDAVLERSAAALLMVVLITAFYEKRSRIG